MAKRAWNVTEEMVMVRSFEGLEDLRFDPKDFFLGTDFTELEEVEKLCIVNGLKQKLADKVAVKKDEKLTPKEQREAMEELWTQLCEERLWNKKAQGKKAEMVSLKKIVVALASRGLNAESIAKAFGKEIEEVEKYMPVTKRKEEIEK